MARTAPGNCRARSICRLPAAALRLTLGVCLASPIPAAAQGGTALDAELVRLEEDLQKLASRNAWEGVDGAYSRMRALEAKGASLSMEQHELGAEAALQLGHIREARGRFGKARTATLDPAQKQRIQGIIKDIDTRFGSVSLVASGKARREANLKIGSAVFAQDARKSIEYANVEVQTKGKFEGLLPVGTYTFGAATFTVTNDRNVVRADAASSGLASVASAPEAAPEPEPRPSKQKVERPPKEKPEPKSKPKASGPGLYVGAGAGSSTWVSKSDSAGYHVPGGTGLAANVRGGVTIPVGAVSLIGDLGWDGSFGSGGEKANMNMVTVGAGVGVGTIVQARLLGHVGFGWGSVVGVDPDAACALPEWQMFSTENEITCQTALHWEGTGVDYSYVAPGGSIGAAYAPEALAGGAVSLDVGLRSLSGQLQPWTALGFRYSFGGGR